MIMFEIISCFWETRRQTEKTNLNLTASEETCLLDYLFPFGYWRQLETGDHCGRDVADWHIRLRDRYAGSQAGSRKRSIVDRD
jgi:hypothetical protein